jgi:hypothetical protein
MNKNLIWMYKFKHLYDETDTSRDVKDGWFTVLVIRASLVA